MSVKQKILFSWLDHRLDLQDEDQGNIDKNGPNYQFHLHHFSQMGYAEHVLLTWKSQAADQRLLGKVQAQMKQLFPTHRISIHFANIEDPINLPAVKAATESTLLAYRGAMCDLFINPGYQMMQLSWFICHQGLGMNTRLLQMRQARYTNSGKPALETIQLEKSAPAHSLMIQRHPVGAQHSAVKEDVCLLPSIARVYDRARHVAQAHNVSTLIFGATGTGKERLATYIHEQDPIRGSRKERLFKVNCAAFSDELLRSELFGHKKGAFTGATNEKEGYFEKADGGTLFLDEIGDISPFMQQALLRVLQDGTFQRVGETKTRQTDVRIVAATNKDLLQLCHEGKFRQDLYYRLAVARLSLPAWSELPSAERETLLDFLVGEKGKEMGVAASLALSQQAQHFLRSFSFPGNIRQLENLIRSLYIFHSEKKEISKNDLLSELGMEGLTFHPADSLKWQEVEKALIEKVLQLHQHNFTHAQKTIGYKSVNTLKKKIREYGIPSKLDD